MSNSTYPTTTARKPLPARGPDLATWLGRQFMIPPATAAVIAVHAGFRLRDDHSASADGAETPSSPRVPSLNTGAPHV